MIASIIPKDVLDPERQPGEPENKPRIILAGTNTDGRNTRGFLYEASQRC
jgi:hypothetical protein